ncbi:protein LYRIC-like isoform X2 [Acipenser ruthenus]|uniref:protein LYRIC-like isoform X2 n=1 Tax=Acipenser ruthenus TaxID=7906 RepID=UPI00274120D0|nr:protein LYRIC-like isoform X2 [Acipenser ruthenus]
MAARWQDIAAQHADVISSHLRELLSTGLDLLHSKLGVDLGLKPEQYPSWVLLLTAFIGLLVIVVVWAAACVGLCAGRKRGARASDTGSHATKTSTSKSVKGEEQKKKNKKKTVEKKPQNGCTILELQEDYVKATSEILKQSEMKVEKQIKKTKKTKAGVKQALHISSGGKEPEDGAWETKISNREKKQQRRRDKVTEDSSLPETQGIVATEHPTSLASVPVLRKIKGEPVRMKPRKGEAIISQVSASWNEAPTVNGGGWNDMAMKLPTQMSGGDGETWTTITKAAAKRNPEPAWGQELEGPGEAGPRTTIADLQLESSRAKIDDQWSGTNGLSTEDPSSDWNAPTEEWGNWDEQKVLPLPQLVGPATEVQKVSDEKEKVDSAAAAAAAAASGKSKKKKKKKKQGEDSSAPVQETGEPEKEPSSELEVPNSEPEMALPEEATPTIELVKLERPDPVMTEPPVTVFDSTCKNIASQVPQRLLEPEPPVSTTKQSNVPSLSQTKSEENWESPKQVQKKKKARRET